MQMIHIIAYPQSIPPRHDPISAVLGVPCIGRPKLTPTFVVPDMRACRRKSSRRAGTKSNFSRPTQFTCRPILPAGKSWIRLSRPSTSYERQKTGRPSRTSRHGSVETPKSTQTPPLFLSLPSPPSPLHQGCLLLNRRALRTAREYMD